MIHVYSNCYLMSDSLAQRYTIRFQIVQEAGGGSAVARPLRGELTTSAPTTKTQFGVWYDLIVDVPFGSTTVGSFDATIPFVFD